MTRYIEVALFVWNCFWMTGGPYPKIVGTSFLFWYLVLDFRCVQAMGFLFLVEVLVFLQNRFLGEVCLKLPNWGTSETKWWPSIEARVKSDRLSRGLGPRYDNFSYGKTILAPEQDRLTRKSWLRQHRLGFFYGRTGHQACVGRKKCNAFLTRPYHGNNAVRRMLLLWRSPDACYARGATLYLWRSSIWVLNTPLKNWLWIKMNSYRMKNPMGPRYTPRITQKLRGRIFRRFWSRWAPSFRKHLRRKVLLPSIVACASNNTLCFWGCYSIEKLLKKIYPSKCIDFWVFSRWGCCRSEGKTFPDDWRVLW